MKLWKNKKGIKEMEMDLRYENIRREIVMAERKLRENREFALEWGKEAAKVGDDELVALAASSLRRIDGSLQQLMKAKTIIGLMYSQGITTNTLQPFFSVIKGINELAVDMGVEEASKARKELEKASRKLANFDILYKTIMKAISPTIDTAGLERYIEEIKTKATVEEENPAEIAKKEIEEIKKIAEDKKITED